MPAYDYKCKKCAHEFEVQMSLQEKTSGVPRICPACTSPDTAQSFGSFMFVKAGSKSSASCSSGNCQSCSGC